MFWNAILKLTWFIFVQGPLQLISAFTKVLEYLTGGIINDILFGSGEKFEFSKIPNQFWWFLAIAFLLFALIFTIQMIILMFKESAETKSRFVLTIQNAAKAFTFMFLIPIFFFLANFIIQNLASSTVSSFANNSNIADYLYHIGDLEWDGTVQEAFNNFEVPINISNYNMIAQLFGVWFMLYAIFVIGIVLVQKVIELFFLFIISPIVMIAMVVDDGKAAAIWKDMVFAKFFASTTTLIGYYVFISATQILIASQLNFLGDTQWAKQLFMILFLCGGALATMAFSDIVACFVGESVGIREGMSSLKSTLAGSKMAMGAGAVTGKALGFMKKNKSKEVINSENNVDTTEVSNSSGGGLIATSFHSINNKMTKQTGLVGLAGLGIGAVGVVVGGSSATLKNSYNSKLKWIEAKSKKKRFLKTKAVALTTLVAPATFAKKGIQAIGRATKTGIDGISDASIGSVKRGYQAVNDKKIENEKNKLKKQQDKNNDEKFKSKN